VGGLGGDRGEGEEDPNERKRRAAAHGRAVPSVDHRASIHGAQLPSALVE